jgi:hypothetical protein
VSGRAGRLIALGAVGVLMLLFGSAELRAVTSPLTGGSVIDHEVAEPASTAAAPATRAKLASSKQSRHRFTSVPIGPAGTVAILVIGAGGLLATAATVGRRRTGPPSWRPRGPPSPVWL